MKTVTSLVVCVLAVPLVGAQQDKGKKEVVDGSEICSTFRKNEAKAYKTFEDKRVLLKPGYDKGDTLHLMKVMKDGNEYKIVIMNWPFEKTKTAIFCFFKDGKEVEDVPLYDSFDGQPKIQIEGDFHSWEVVKGAYVVTLKNCKIIKK